MYKLFISQRSVQNEIVTSLRVSLAVLFERSIGGGKNQLYCNVLVSFSFVFDIEAPVFSQNCMCTAQQLQLQS